MALQLAAHEAAACRVIDELLARVADELAAADEIIICREGGFGHQLHGPDSIRRLYAGRHSVFLFIEWPGRHNPFVPLFGGEPRILHIPSLPASLSREHREALARNMTDWTTRLLYYIQEWIDVRLQRNAVDYEGYLHYLACARPVPHYGFRSGTRIPYAQIAYLDLHRRTAAPPRRLPEPLRTRIASFLAQRYGGAGSDSGPRIATLYLRQKGGPADSASRSGSPPQDYLPIILHLRDKGYAVFIIGDVPLICDGANFAGHVANSMTDAGEHIQIIAQIKEIDPVNFQYNWDLYARNPNFLLHRIMELYFMTEGSICIGESGGALQLAPYDGTPSVMINAFPYGMGLPNTSVLFKVVENAEGELAPYQALLSRYSWTYEFPGLNLRTNTPLEMLDAVATAVASIDRHPIGVGAQQLIGAPDNLWLLYCNSTVSPAFFRIYERGRTMAAMP